MNVNEWLKAYERGRFSIQGRFEDAHELESECERIAREAGYTSWVVSGRSLIRRIEEVSRVLKVLKSNLYDSFRYEVVIHQVRMVSQVVLDVVELRRGGVPDTGFRLTVRAHSAPDRIRICRARIPDDDGWSFSNATEMRKYLAMHRLDE